jgi:hypothetical protein
MATVIWVIMVAEVTITDGAEDAGIITAGDVVITTVTITDTSAGEHLR